MCWLYGNFKETAGGNPCAVKSFGRPHVIGAHVKSIEQGFCILASAVPGGNGPARPRGLAPAVHR